MKGGNKMASLTSAVNVQVDSKTKKEATNILNKLGISMSTLINATLKQVVINNGIPFDLSLEKKPSRDLLKALKEAEDIKAHPEKYKSYDNVDELFKDILGDEYKEK